jgi:class 3 adenylate cyclase
MGKRTSFFELDKYSTVQSRYTGIPINEEYCSFSITVYPSIEMEKQYKSSNPLVVSLLSFLIIVLISVGFLIYDSKVEQRQKAVMTTAARSANMLSTLFPANVCDQLLEEEPNDYNKLTKKSIVNMGYFGGNVKNAVTGSGAVSGNDFGDGTSDNKNASNKFSQPIAELYPETTVLFADISGFTVWSSSRGPDQVFHLLESLYSEFDTIARKRRVFKVETIGDTYVAVTGLPKPMKNHAAVMVKFAEDMLERMDEIVNDLSTQLGPDTSDLKMRVGLNSGPTTAGVIRGEKSRFQLFGDTVNTASRMESTSRMESNGKPGCIQCSPKTADLLRDDGKDHWLTQRLDVVQVKGKGEMITYWVQTQTSKAEFIHLSEYSDFDGNQNRVISAGDSSSCKPFELSSTDLRLVDWNLDIFKVLLMDVVASRRIRNKATNRFDDFNVCLEAIPSESVHVPLDEVVEVIDLPDNFGDTNVDSECVKSITLDPVVCQQLYDYLKAVALLYNDNPFHNFEHASHVVMSTKNLLSCIASPNGHDQKHGIWLDPLSRFAIVFGALIHDVGHLGVPNSQLIKEETCNAAMYKNRCVAEQNSFDVAWALFMKPQFLALRKYLFVEEAEFK